MTFKTEQLFDTHKKKFCFGNSVDPARIHSRISGKGGSNTERKDRQEFQIVSQLVCCKGIYTLLSKRLHIPMFPCSHRRRINYHKQIAVNVLVVDKCQFEFDILWVYASIKFLLLLVRSKLLEC